MLGNLCACKIIIKIICNMHTSVVWLTLPLPTLGTGKCALTIFWSEAAPSPDNDELTAGLIPGNMKNDVKIVSVYLYITLSYYHHNYPVVSRTIEHMKLLLSIFCRVCLKLSPAHSLIHFMQYGTVCFKLTQFSFDDYESICTSSCHHQQIVDIKHLPLFKVIKQWYMLYVLLYSYIRMIYFLWFLAYRHVNFKHSL